MRITMNLIKFDNMKPEPGLPIRLNGEKVGTIIRETEEGIFECELDDKTAVSIFNRNDNVIWVLEGRNDKVRL